MKALCTLDQLREELYYDRQISLIKDVNSELEEGFLSALRKMKVEGRVQNVGSTNRARLTFVYGDPTSDKFPFPPDFDIDIIVKGEIPEDKAIELMTSALPKWRYRKMRSRIVFNCVYDGLFVTAEVLDEKKAARNVPDIYAAVSPPLNPDQSLEIRVLKLIAMRLGAYGSFARGIKGIALEEMTRKYGNAENVLETLEERPMKVPSPVDKSNLLRQVSENAWKRMLSAKEVYKETGMVKAYAFNETDWREAHNSSVTFLESSPLCPVACGLEEFDIYGIFSSPFKNMVENDNITGFDIYLIPCGGSASCRPHTDFYIAVEGIPENWCEPMKTEFQRELKLTEESYWPSAVNYSGKRHW